MKLTLQIAFGIFVAGILTWLFWIGVFTAAVPVLKDAIPKTTVDISHVLQPTVGLPTAPPAPPPLQHRCVNFVQMQNGERHCLEDLPRASVQRGSH